MKKLLLLTLVCCAFTISNAQTSKKEQITELFSGVSAMADVSISEQLPIQSVNISAAEKADKSVALTGENIETVLKEAANYSAVFITVGVHTIVKITDLADCKASGAWGTCMPMGEGFVQKTGLNAKKDYINNIIGVPDTQRRTVFMFK